jgi:parallel beta-helix repeat protein
MKSKLRLWCAAGLLVALTRASAATHYVDAASTNAVPPFTNWANATAVIQDAVDAAAPGDEIVVTNGVYQTGARAVYGMSNRVAVTKGVTVRSVNGPEVTSILGSGPSGPTAVRCVYLTNGAVLAGFTLTNGTTQVNDDPWVSSSSTSGGGLWSESQTAVATNCVLAGNSAFALGGGAYSGTLKHCTLRGNSAISGGGAAGSALNDCTLSGNLASSGWTASASGGGAAWSALTNCTLVSNGADTGGGAYESTLDNCMLAGNGAGSAGGARSSTLTNCTVSGNSVENGAGGVAVCTLNNCTLANNTAYGSSGGGAYASTLNNCIVTGNSAGGFGGGGAFLSTLNNCTLTRNKAYSGGGATWSTVNNCIVYYNSNFEDDEDGLEDENNYYTSTVNYSCTTPMPESGVGNITNAPLFVDTNGWSNLRLQSNSSCINAGNNAYVTTATDLDGLPRIAGGTVDIGAYEFQSPASMISYAWLQQSGLPTDGSADYVDTDHDGHNNWQEWMAGTDPTNALSVLWLASPVITPTNVTLTWTSVTNRTYTLEQATNLNGTPAFSVLRSNLAGRPGTTSWTDTNAPVSSPRFYQLRVSP